MQKENEEKDQKYISILRELEIKDTTIFSLENMLMRKDEEIQKLNNLQKLNANYYNNNSGYNYNDYEEGNNNNNNASNNRYFQNTNSSRKDLTYEEDISMRESNSLLKNNFNKDSANENELKNLIKGNYHNRKHSESLNFSKDNTQFDSNLGNFNSKNLNESNTSMKIPGRIVSLKKK